MAIAEQMGAQLEKTALSVNVKERMDFSCAIFNKDGELVANAPHIPIHLGSMGESVRAIIKQQHNKMRPGDAYILNSPFLGGTHLPDITIIQPVFIHQHIEFFVASRAHHADIGGKTPGSFPADSQHIQTEGIVFSGEKIVTDGKFLQDKLIALLQHPPYPARNIQQNIADIQAQLAANQKGIQALQQVTAEYGLKQVQQQMAEVLDHGEACVKAALTKLSNGQGKTTLDNGAEIHVRIEVHPKNEAITIDFSGTSPQQANNFNAPLAVTKAAVLYVFRILIEEDIPLNEGCFRPIHLVVPKGSMIHAHYPAAVVAGNVETSQHIVDALYQALGILAGSQGTMNNILFGKASFQYYETLAGGAGAGQGFAGASAVHTHMTNSRLTDPEILENRFPVLLQQFSIRQNSYGKGHWPGGNGVTRGLYFFSGMQVSLLTSHRHQAPLGLHGGNAAKTGENWLIDQHGKHHPLPATISFHIHAGESLLINTPGGGGYGRESEQEASSDGPQ